MPGSNAYSLSDETRVLPFVDPALAAVILGREEAGLYGALDVFATVLPAEADEPSLSAIEVAILIRLLSPRGVGNLVQGVDLYDGRALARIEDLARSLGRRSEEGGGFVAHVDIGRRRERDDEFKHDDRGNDKGEREGEPPKSGEDTESAAPEDSGSRGDERLTTLLDALGLQAAFERVRESIDPRTFDAIDPKERWKLELSLPAPVRPVVEASAAEIHGAAEQLPVPGALPDATYDGRGVIVAVADFGCDFALRGFRRGGGSTRLRALWDQNVQPAIPGLTPPPAAPPGFGFGAEFLNARLDRALLVDDPYTALPYHPEANYYLPRPFEAAHGTLVLDIAAGGGQGTGATGLAPGADLVFVQIARAGVAPFTASEIAIFHAARYVFERAATFGGTSRPAVLNLSLGHNMGAHDGSRALELALDALLKVDGRAIVIAAGNTRAQRRHATGLVRPSAPSTLRWQFAAPEDWTAPREPGAAPGLQRLEIWYDGADDLTVTLGTPDGQALGPIAPGTFRKILRDGVRIGAVFGSSVSVQNGSRRIHVELYAVNSAAEEWTLTLRHPGNPDEPDLDEITYHAWIEADDGSHSRFGLEDSDPSCTLSGMATGRATIVVGAYDGLSVARRAALFTSAGPTRDGRRKPEISAPGVGVFAARALGDRRRDPALPWRTPARSAASGTSIAAPHVAGALALLFQKLPALDNAGLRDRLIATARLVPPLRPDDAPAAPIPFWDPLFGAGRLDAGALVRRP